MAVAFFLTFAVASSSVLAASAAVDNGASPAPAQATFGIGPAGPKGIDGRAYFNYLESPGATLSDNVAVVNVATSPVTLSVYPTDAVPGSDGAANLLPAGVVPTGVGAWTTLHTSTRSATVTVAPRATLVVPMTVSVPATATPGDHVGGIVVSLATYAKNAQGDIVHVDQRVAVRVFLRVSGQLEARFSVEDLRAGYQQNYDPVGKGGVSVSYDIRNTGNLKLAARQEVQFRGLLGTTRTVTQLPDLPVLMPGALVHTTLRLPSVPPEFLGTVRVLVTPSAAAGDVDPHLTGYQGKTHLLAVPVALLIAVAALLLVVLAARRHRAAPVDIGVPSARGRLAA